MPYITASIILQLLTVVVPSLEKLSKEGEVGQARITQYTRYLTVGLAFAQSIGYVFLFKSFAPKAGEQVLKHNDIAHIFLDRDHADRGLRAADVDGRADHPTRDRQRHLAADLRLDHLAPAARAAGLVDVRQRDVQGDDAVHRRVRRRGRRVRPRGPAKNPGAVRQTRHRPAHDRRAARPTCRCA